MRSVILLLLAITITSASVFADGASRLPDVIRDIRPAIVGVGTFMQARPVPVRLLGSGFVVTDGRHVVTNLHVIDGQLDEEKRESIAVFTGRGRDSGIRTATRVAADREHDLALLRISGGPLPALTLGDSAHVREGELYAFTGFPIGMALGLYPVTHRGIVSAITPIVTPVDESGQLDRDMINRLRAPFDVFQLDATAYPGNSGSPLYSADDGKVIGIINMVFVKESKENILAKPSGITYAIPARYITDLLRQDGVDD